MLAAVAAVAALSAAGTPGLHAQADESTLVGTVVDESNGHPLVGAFVHLVGEDRGVFTDERGRFVYPDFPIGIVEVGVEQLGYADLVRTVGPARGDADLVLSLAPRPMLLEGLEIVMDRFENRRRAVAVSSRVFEREQLLTASAWDALDFIESRTLLRALHCPAGLLAHGCARLRGRIVPIEVYIDEAPVIGGIDYLRSYRPHDLHRIEVYAGGRHIRVFTEGFLEWAGRTRLNPIAFVR